jgi:group II intron reverse transcriptase/maturase
MKSLNKGGQSPAEGMEGRGLAKGTPPQQNTLRAQDRDGVPSALERVRQAAKRDKDLRFTSLFHLVYPIECLRWAYHALKRDASAGVDGVTWQAYGTKLQENLADLSERLRRGAYHARPARRVYILKPDGRQRPLGVPALEDKIVQKAVVRVLNAIYEVDFKSFSHGSRPGHKPHDALDEIYVRLSGKVSWVLDADLRSFYDTVDHQWLMKFLEHRIADGPILRLIQKWLSAGVLEDGKVLHADLGTPQGGVASPLLANVYLHYVLDVWSQAWRHDFAKGEMYVVRYVDDFVAMFQKEADARRYWHDLAERLSKFKLELHPDKTRLVDFGRFATQNRKAKGLPKPATFDFLGFTHICGKTHEGKFSIYRYTIRKRLLAKIQSMKTEIQQRQHEAVAETGKWLSSVIRGYVNYFGVPSNYRALGRFRDALIWHWFRTLKRRSQRDKMTWDRMNQLAEYMLPKVRIVHPYPSTRFGVQT